MTEAQSYKKSALLGMISKLVLTIGTKLIDAVAQLALGWFLLKSDYGVYAIAIGINAFFTFLTGGALTRLLIQKKDEFEHWAPPIITVSVVLNLLVGLMLVLGSGLFARMYDTSQLQPILVIIGVSVAISIFGMLGQAKMAADLKFVKIDTITGISFLIQQTTMILLAYLGAGVYSLALPILISRMYESWAFGGFDIFNSKVIDFSKSNIAKIIEVYREGRWVILSSALITMSQTGFLVGMGFLLNISDMGVFFFGFQISAAISTTFTSGIRGVMFPVFANLKSDPERQQAAYIKCLDALSLICTPCFAMAYLLLPWAITLFWKDKWSAAIVVSQLIVLALASRVLAPLGLAATEARGKWHIVTLLLFIEAAGTFLFGVIGAMFGGLVWIAALICIYRFGCGIMQVQFYSKQVEVGQFKALMLYMPKILVAAAGLGLALLFTRNMSLTELQPALIAGTIFSLTYLLLTGLLMRDSYKNILFLIKRKK